MIYNFLFYKISKCATLIILYLLVHVGSINGQIIANVSFENEINVCQTNELIIQVKNTNASSLSNLNLSLNLPCGLLYLSKSVEQATEANIDNLSNPIFIIQNIAPNGQVTLRFKIEVSCATKACLDMNEQVIISGQLFSNSTSQQFNSQPFNITSPNLAIISLDKPYEEIPSYSSTIRKLSIKNTRQGRLNALTVRHDYDNFISVEPTRGKITFRNNQYMLVVFDSTDFKKIGNRDPWLDFNELLEYEEKITTNFCANYISFVKSKYTTSWGCNEVMCQESTAFGNFRIIYPNDVGPKILIDKIITEPLCYNNNTAVQQITITKRPHLTEITNFNLTIERENSYVGFKIGSVVTTADAEIEYLGLSTNFCGERFAETIKINVRSWAPSSSQEIFNIKWETLHCEETSCLTLSTIWTYNGSYKKECTRTDDTYHNFEASPVVSLKTKASLVNIDPLKVDKSNMVTPATFRDNDRGFLRFTFTDTRYNYPNEGKFNIQLQVPKGIILGNTDFELNNKLPISIMTTMNEKYNIYELSYETPFNSKTLSFDLPFTIDCDRVVDDFGCEDSYSVCLKENSFIDVIRVKTRLIYDDACIEANQPVGCGELGYHILCPQLTPCYKDTIDAVWAHKANITRITLGKPDFDEDFFPDSTSQPIDFVNNMFLAGDTFKISVNGAIKSLSKSMKYKYLITRVVPNLFYAKTQAELDLYTNMLHGELGGIKIINSKVDILQASSGRKFTFDKIIAYYDLYNYNLILSADSLLKYNPFSDLPRDFLFADGDSISVEIYKMIDFEVFRKNKTKIDFYQIYQFTYGLHTLVSNEIPTEKLISSPCDYFFKNIFFPQMEFTKLPQGVSFFIPTPNLCSNDFTNRKILELNFGHQYALEFDSTKFKVFKNEIREIIRLGKIIVSTEQQDVEFGKLTIEFLNKTFVLEPDKAGGEITYDLPKDLIPFSGYAAPSQIPKILRIFLEDKPRDCITRVRNPTAQIKILFELSEVGKIYFPDSVQTKITYNYPKPLISAFIKLKELTSFSKDFSIPFDIIGSPTQVRLNYVFLKITNPSGNLKDIKIINTFNNDTFTSTNGYFNVGAILQNTARSFSIVGTSVGCGKEMIILEYGFDCQNYTGFGNSPCFSSFDTMYVSFPEGLIDLYFKEPLTSTITLCDTVDQQVTIYNAGLGRAYDINLKILPPEGVSIVKGSAKILYNGGQNEVILTPIDRDLQGQYVWQLSDEWNFHKLNGLPGTGDTLSNEFDLIFKVLTDCDITSGLPVYYSINGKSICNKTTNRITKSSAPLEVEDVLPSENIIINAQLSLLGECKRDQAIVHVDFISPMTSDKKLFLKLPIGWSLEDQSVEGSITSMPIQVSTNLYAWDLSNQSLQTNFSFKIINESGYLCGLEQILLYLSTPTVAFCRSNEVDCDIQITSGSKNLELDIQQAKFEVLEGKIEIAQGISKVYAEINQISGNWHSPLKMIIFDDADNDGLFSVGENVLLSEDILNFTSSTNNIKRWFSLPSSIDPNTYCRLVLGILANDNCLCDDIYHPMNRSIEIYNEAFSICSEDEIGIGVQLSPEAQFYWGNNLGLACNDCAQTIFSVENNEVSKKEFNNVLYVDEKGCLTNYHYTIIVNPTPKIFTNTDNICQGDTLKIIASEGESHLWQGPNIIQNGKSELLAVPTDNSVYTVSITDFQGCRGEAKISVNVLPYPSIEILHSEEQCADTNAILNVLLQDYQNFLWVNANRLANANTLSPRILEYSDFTYVLEAANSGCKSLFLLPITFSPPSKTSMTIEICEGEAYLFDNLLLRYSGEYCKFITRDGLCDSTFCLNLIVHPVPKITNPIDTIYKESNVDITINAPSGYVDYLWSPSDNLSCTNCPNPVYNGNTEINFEVKIIDRNGCSSSARIIVKIKDNCVLDDFILPNAFTPNDDGYLDTYTLGDYEFCGPLRFKVYNRWGQKVYEEDNWDNNWSGKSFNNVILPQGTYFVEVSIPSLGIYKNTMVDLRIK